MARTSLRRQDSLNESQLQPYLDLVYAHLGFCFERVHDRERQLDGIDVVIQVLGKDYCIDEKAQTHYVNRPIPTFAFELEFSSAGVVREGWLFDEAKRTTHYFLVSNIQSSGETLNGLKCFRLVSINRRKLVQYLKTKNWTQSYFQEAKSMVTDHEPRYELSPKSPKARLIRTTHLAEEPLNLVIVLDDLIAAGVGKELMPAQEHKWPLKLLEAFAKLP